MTYVLEKMVLMLVIGTQVFINGMMKIKITLINLLNGVKFENEVINLWVDESITKKQIKENCLFINKK